MQYQFVFTDWFNRNLKALGKHNPALRQAIEAFLHSFNADDTIRLFPIPAVQEKLECAPKGGASVAAIV